MGKREKKDNPDKIGAVKFWAWQSRGLSAAVNFIILGFVSIYCTDTLGMPPALIGTLLMASKAVDAVTDLFGGYLVDKTNTKLGKGRPYELAILGAWLCTWIMYSAPQEASIVVKSVWVLSMYICINAVCITLLSACNNAYMIRAFKTNGQRIKLASFGGIVIMVASIAVNMIFPIAMNRIATSPAGWRKMIAMFAIPMAFIGILRFLFVKETNQVEVTEEKVKLKDVGLVLKKNPYVYMVAIMQIVYSLVTGMGVNTYFYMYVVGNVELMGLISSISIVVLPIMFFFPMIMKKVPMGKMVQIGCIAYGIGGFITFAAGGNIKMLIAATIFTGLGVLPITYLTDLMMIDCASYNAWKGFKRMDGTIGAIKGFAGKLGGALGSGVMGVLLSMSGYNGGAAQQSESALLMIRALMGLIPAILFIAVAVMMAFYKLDKLMPEINQSMEKIAAKKAEAEK